ncbi:uncharacterized protein LOC112637062 isoform X2 [Camponotus floridanus]|uniref:uncharacterized protein LOC112637062 isoform X2 n=1 Tax=Camponotus floridanus TaxID=104421 RepID=UPI000DC6981D|nr:uncharacterized protein LOC112637062 isoform X2 [Camponotus floridanus]
MPWCAFIIQYSQANAASLEKEDPSGIYHNIIIIRQQDLLPLSFPKIPSIMDEKPRNFRAFKRALNRKVEREIAKRTKLERIASVLYKRYGKSESNNESENESEHIVNQCYIINANHDKNNDVTGDNNINVFNCNNDEDDHNESDNLENNELLRHDASNSELSIENFSDNENSRVHDTESTHTCTESDVEGIGVQELVSSDETDIEEEQIHCLHINEIGQYVAIKIKEWACEEGRELTQEDDEFYDVGRTEWITDIDENMEAKIKWPPCNAGKFVQKELPASPDWIEERIIIRKFYDARINAIISCKGIIDDSNYETDKEFGKGMRKKKKNCFFDSSESEKESDNNKCPVKSKTIEKNNKKQFKKYTNVSKNIKKIAPPPSISASFCKSTCMLSPERQSKTRQHIKQPKLPLNIKISESSKQSHTDTINVLRNIREKNKESDKRTQLFERLKKHGHEKLHKYEEKAALSSMQETLQEQNIYEIQEAIILSPLKEKETPQKNDRSLRSPLQMLSPNYCNNSNKSYCHLFKTPEKNNNSSPLKSSETESYTAYHLSPSLLQPVTRKGNERKNNNSSPLKSSGTESYTAHHLSPSLLQPVTRKGNERKNNNSSPLKSSGTESYTAHHLSPSLLQPVTRKGNEKDSSLQTMLANCIYKLDENMKITKQINSKMDIFIMNQEKLHRYLLPGEKVVKRPSGLPSFPVETEHELNQMEEFLKDDNNLSAATFYFAKFIDPKSIENSVRKLLSKILSNSVANNYNFHGTRGKQRFKDLKIWELVQGALMTRFEAKDLTVCDKVASTWLANAPWRK